MTQGQPIIPNRGGCFWLIQLATLSSLPACAGTIPPRTRRSTTLDTIIATFCIPDDLLHIPHHRNDPQAKITDREILIIAILACQEFAGNMRKALQWGKALRLFSFVPSESRFTRRRHRLMPPLHALAPPLRAVWETLPTCTADALDTFPMPVCEHIRANRCRLEKAFRGYRASHRDYFHGVKVHLWVASGGFIVAFWLTPGSWHDLTELYGMALDIPCGCALVMNCGYTDYVAADLLREAEGLEGYPVRGIPDGRFIVQGGVGMLKWQTSVPARYAYRAGILYLHAGRTL